MKTITKEVIDHMEQIYPSSLEKYHKLDRLGVTDPFCGHDFAVISLARQCFVERILPVAFFELSAGSLSSPLFKRDERGLDKLEDLRDIIDTAHIGRRKLDDALRATLIRFIDEQSPEDCQSKKKCFSKKNICFARVRKQLLDEVFVVFGKFDWFKDNWSGICDICMAAFKTSLQEAQAEIWEELPGYFGLQPWEALKRHVDEP